MPTASRLSATVAAPGGSEGQLVMAGVPLPGHKAMVTWLACSAAALCDVAVVIASGTRAAQWPPAVLVPACLPIAYRLCVAAAGVNADGGRVFAVWASAVCSGAAPA